MNTTLLILAAGIGSRFGGVKQLAPVGPAGETILEYSIYDAMRSGIRRVVFVMRPDIASDIDTLLARGAGGRIDTAYAMQTLDTAVEEFAISPERSNPWGTGHAVLSAADQVDGPFVVINADDFYGAESFRIAAGFFEQLAATDRDASALVAFHLASTLSEAGSVSRGVCTCATDGTLRALTEHKRIASANGAIRCAESAAPLDPAALVSMNMWAFPKTIMRHLQTRFRAFLAQHGDSADAEFGLPTVIDDLIQSKEARVHVLPTPETWCGITYADDAPWVRKHVQSLVERGVYPCPLWS